MRASWYVMRHMAYQPWIGLPNILARDFVVPELLQDAATPEALADAVWTQLHDAQKQASQRQRFTDMHHSLLRDTARESAQAVMRLIDTSRTSC
jgi:lipid-A-disaccharide synthase